jgi:hypothetical protein
VLDIVDQLQDLNLVAIETTDRLAMSNTIIVGVDNPMQIQRGILENIVIGMDYNSLIDIEKVLTIFDEKDCYHHMFINTNLIDRSIVLYNTTASDQDTADCIVSGLIFSLGLLVDAPSFGFWRRDSENALRVEAVRALTCVYSLPIDQLYSLGDASQVIRQANIEIPDDCVSQTE